MTRIRLTFALGAALIAISVVDWAIDVQPGLGWIPEAQAIVGRPLTPVSVAGVARRTTRRAVAVESTAAAASASAAAATAAQPTATTAVPAAVPATGALPLGTVVPALPSGCTQTTSAGVQYYKCGSDYYRTAFQGTNLVYVTAKP